jgi:hypothetical protein
MKPRQKQQGNVLAEAIVIFGVLVALLTAVHLTGRWQYQWLGYQLDTQTQATALALEHKGQSMLDRHSQDLTRTLAEREFRLGASHWLHLKREARFKQHAWRLVGTGQASTDSAATQRLTQAQRLWMQTNGHSQRVVARLQPSLEAIEVALRRRGSMTDWTRTWQGSSPDDYLKGISRFGAKPGLLGRFIEEALPW